MELKDMKVSDSEQCMKNYRQHQVTILDRVGTYLSLPTFLDVHKVPFTEDSLQELRMSPPDEFGVTLVNMFYNKESSVCFCLLNAPNIDAVKKHHEKLNVQCEWITEVTNIVNDNFKMYEAKK